MVDTYKPSEESQSVQTETTGLHEMKEFNQVHDQLWIYDEVLWHASSLDEIDKTIKELRSLVTRADDLWVRINLAFQAKYNKMALKGQSIYKGELEEQLKELERVDRYLRFLDERALPMDLLNDKEFIDLRSGDAYEKLYSIQKKLDQIIRNVGKTWGEAEVAANMNLPLRVKEEDNLFFRHGS